MSRGFLILGATSPMARAAAGELAARGDRVFLAARDLEECERIQKDLVIRFAAIAGTGRFESAEPEHHADLVEEASAFLDGIDGVLVLVGNMGGSANTLDPDETARLFQVNLGGVASMLGACARKMADRGHGVILGVASVAGDRGRQSNFVYGAAKGGLALYLQGLRNLMHARGVRVVTFKPGFVDTAMTFGRPGVFLAASPRRAGRALVRALDQASGTVYFPWPWRWIMTVIRWIPEPLFMRLRL